MSAHAPAPGSIVLPDHVWETYLEALGPRDVGAAFRLARQYAGASQQRIAAATGLPQSRVSTLMSGKSGPVRAIDVLHRIADGLGMPDPVRLAWGLAPRARGPQG